MKRRVVTLAWRGCGTTSATGSLVRIVACEPAENWNFNSGYLNDLWSNLIT